jgi:hypothetical protein
MVYLYPMSVLFSIEQVTPGVFHLHFKEHLELAAHFLRFQEFYESPEFVGKPFDILTYVKWYASQNEGNFSYFNDWSGFNIPTEVIHRCMRGVKDPNPYDRFMVSIAEWCESQHGKGAYLIGTSDKSAKSIRHEIAHGLWHVNKKYQVDQKRNLLTFRRAYDSYDKLLEWLGEKYEYNVIEDEMQAFLATGLKGSGIKLSPAARRSFVRTFEEYCPLKK